MPALNFPASSSSPWTAPNGVIYTWNTDGYWEAKADPNDFDTDYLKLNATNDPVTGNLALDQDLDVGDNLAVTGTSAFTGNVSAAANLAVTGTSAFTGLTTHEAGVSVTGGTVNDISSGIARQSQILRFNNFVNTTGNASLYKFQFDADNSAIEPNSIITYLNTDVDLGSFSGKARGIVCGTVSSGAIGESINFYAHAAANRTNVESIYGFYGDVKQSNTSTQERYNFYAAGNAPNYFAGATRIGGFATGSFNPGYGNTDVGFVGATFADTTKGAILYISRRDGFCSSFNTNTVGNLMDFRSGGAQAGYLNVTADTGVLLVSNSATGPVIVQNSDARVKTLTPFTGNAADVVSQLNPGVNGFIAHELQQYVADAVTGTQDATEAIGTLADYDGTVLESDVTEPEELEYTEEVETDGVATMVTRTRTWTPSGTRPVYQGVDLTKLIPLLTKALQEALERIEALEAQLNP